MAFEDPWFRDGKAISPLDHERRMYEQTQNPLHAWRALQICVELMAAGAYRCDSLPPWLLAYLRTSAAGLEEAFGADTEADPVDVRPVIASVFGFKQPGRGVRRQAFQEWTHVARDREWAMQVHHERRRQPAQSIEASVAAVSEAQQVSLETVWRAWSTWKGFVDDLR